MKEINKTNFLTRVLFAIYLIAIFWIIVLKFNIPFHYPGNMRSLNLVPYNEPLIINGRLNLIEMIMNVGIFVPLGIYTGVLFKGWITIKKLFLFLLISLLCEGLQFILVIGAFDITDIINNTIGGIVGLVLYKGIEKAFKNSSKTQKFINIISLTGTILMILFLFLLKINRLWIFRMQS